MRRAGKLALVLLILACCTLGLSKTASASRGGVTVTPGSLTLTLEQGASEQSTEFTLINHYGTAINLQFAFEPRAGVAANQGEMPSEAFAISRTEITLKPSESTNQKITLRDRNLGPGSHLADLVITQSGGPASGVGIVSSIRVPITVLKKAGAITTIELTEFSIPRLSLDLPSTLAVTIHNTGNVIAIPRGTVTISKLGGGVVRQGVLNTGSTAISPGGKLTIATPLTNLTTKPFLPGIYRATINYGSGGDQAGASVSRTFVYIAWWHMLTVTVVIVAGFYLLKYRPMQKPKKQTATRKTVKAGRRAS